MKKHEITLKLNGEIRTVDVVPNDVLLDVLREKLGVKSPKIGCERGDCGACTVILNGRTVRSCLVLAIEADGSEIITVEGLGDGKLTGLQQSLLETNSFQCGFCAPGVILTATEFLNTHAQPSDHDVKEAISGHLCRCTGYQPIVDGILKSCSRTGQVDPAGRSE